jgi:hypothetical protein
MVSSIALPVLLRAPPIAGGGVDKAGERSRRDQQSLTSLEGGVAAQPAPSQKRHARRPRPDGESQCEVPDCEPSRVSRGHEIFSAMLGSEHGKYACQLIHSQ